MKAQTDLGLGPLIQLHVLYRVPITDFGRIVQANARRAPLSGRPWLL